MLGVFLYLCFLLCLTGTQVLGSVPAPTSVRVEKINSTAFIARWDPIPDEYVPGAKLVGYYLEGYAISTSARAFYLTGQKTSATVTGLKDWDGYTMKVYGFTNRGQLGIKASTSFYGSSTPTNTKISLSRISPSAFIARWNPIPNVLGYKVQLRNNALGTLIQVNTTNATSIEMHGAKASTRYTVYVQGYTSSELWQSSFLHIFWELYPKPENLQVKILNKTAVSVSWDPILSKTLGFSIAGYIVRLHRFAPDENFPDVSTNINTTSVVFTDLKDWQKYTVYVNGKKGSKASKEFYIGEIPFPNNPEINRINTTAVFIRWDPIPKDKVSGVLLGYVVTLRNFSNSILQQQNTVENKLVINQLEKDVRYFVIIQGYTATERGKPSINSILKTDLLSLVPIVKGLDVTSISNTTANAKWNPVPLEYVVGSQLGYKVDLTRNEYGAASSDKKQWNISKTALMMTDLRPASKYSVDVVGYNVDYNVSKDKASKTFFTGCGSTLKNQGQGKINFTWYDIVYQNTPNCIWRIEEQNLKIVISLDFLHLKPDYLNCSHAFLKITNGQGKVLSKLCKFANSTQIDSFGSATIQLMLSHLTQEWWGHFKLQLSYRTGNFDWLKLGETSIDAGKASNCWATKVECTVYT